MRSLAPAPRQVRRPRRTCQWPAPTAAVDSLAAAAGPPAAAAGATSRTASARTGPPRGPADRRARRGPGCTSVQRGRAATSSVVDRNRDALWWRAVAGSGCAGPELVGSAGARASIVRAAVHGVGRFGAAGHVRVVARLPVGRVERRALPLVILTLAVADRAGGRVVHLQAPLRHVGRARRGLIEAGGTVRVRAARGIGVNVRTPARPQRGQRRHHENRRGRRAESRPSPECPCRSVGSTHGRESTASVVPRPGKRLGHLGRAPACAPSSRPLERGTHATETSLRRHDAVFGRDARRAFLSTLLTGSVSVRPVATWRSVCAP